MKYSFFILLTVLVGCSPSPEEKSIPIRREKLQSDYIDLIVKTKEDKDVTLAYKVHYRGKHNFKKKKDTSNIHLNQSIRDSLRQFKVNEMYISKRDSMEIIIRSLVETEFETTKIIIERVELYDIDIPKKDYDRMITIEKLKQQYMEQLFELREESFDLEERLKTHDNLPEKERLKIKTKLVILEKEEKVVQKKRKAIGYE